MAVNRARLSRARQSMSERQRDVLNLLPLLFHVNHPLLPGYVSKSTPCGLFDYAPDSETLRLVRRLNKSFELKRRAALRNQVDALYIMGSVGSIGFNRSSDVDAWLCPAPGISADQRKELLEKAHRIEKWANESGMELHFFLVEAESFRIGADSDLSAESSGSSQHYLLLDEFYRSGLLVAGKPPLWWAVPPDNEFDYDGYIAEQVAQRTIDTSHFLDFGAVSEVPPEEFFGAALWQLYKSIDSPYKSLLKLLLAEVYADEHPQIDMLSMRYKRVACSEDPDAFATDPYLLLYSKIDEYLAKSNDRPRMELLRRSFYLKLGISRHSNRERPSWQWPLVERVVTEWGWDNAILDQLDNRGTWSVDKLVRERAALMQALTTSYRRLSDFARRHQGNPRITQSDLTVLGRKLYSAFERRPGKIEIVNRGFDTSLEAEQLLFDRQQDRGGSGWRLVQLEGTHQRQLMRADSALELLAWAHVNGILTSATSVNSDPSRTNINAAQLRRCAAALESHLPEGKLPRSSHRDLHASTRVRKFILVVNFGDSLRDGVAAEQNFIATNQADALNFSGTRLNLVTRFDLLTITSWEELHIQHFSGETALTDCLGAMATTCLQQEVPETSVYAFDDRYGAAITRRIDGLLREVIASLALNDAAPLSCYVMEVAGKPCVLRRNRSEINGAWLTDESALTRELGSVSEGFVMTRFDSRAFTKSLYPPLYKLNRAGHVQVFLLGLRDSTSVFVLDEYGALFTQRLAGEVHPVLVDQLGRFLLGCIERRAVNADRSLDARRYLTFYDVTLSKKRQWQIHVRDWTSVPPSEYWSVQVVGHFTDDKLEGPVKIYCDNQEFSSLEIGDDVYQAVGRHILSRRRDGSRYPVYVTDISYPWQPVAQFAPPQTSVSLRWKRAVENRINAALQAPEESPQALRIA